MEDRRSLLEWIFDTAATIGLVVAIFSIIFRDRYPNFDVGAIAFALFGIGLFAGGVVGSRRCKEKRLSAVINGAQHKDGHAN